MSLLKKFRFGGRLNSFAGGIHALHSVEVANIRHAQLPFGFLRCWDPHPSHAQQLQLDFPRPQPCCFRCQQYCHPWPSSSSLNEPCNRVWMISNCLQLFRLTSLCPLPNASLMQTGAPFPCVYSRGISAVKPTVRPSTSIKIHLRPIQSLFSFVELPGEPKQSISNKFKFFPEVNNPSKGVKGPFKWGVYHVYCVWTPCSPYHVNEQHIY